MSAIFTAAMLENAGACQPQIDLFRATFGESVNVTVAKASKVGGKFDWNYATRFLDAEGKAEYGRVTGVAIAEYGRVTGPAWAEHERVEGSALAEYERVEGAAWAEYERVEGSALASAYIATCKRAAARATPGREQSVTA